MSSFSHLDADGRPAMVDVSDKQISRRQAVATGKVILPKEVILQFQNQDISTKKGPVFQTAILAGIMGVKQTSALIPLCHPLPITKCHISINLNEQEEVQIECAVITDGKTGVEMEALTGVSVAALTIYDMCKAFSHEIVIKDIQLISKSGGKSDYMKS